MKSSNLIIALLNLCLIGISYSCTTQKQVVVSPLLTQSTEDSIKTKILTHEILSDHLVGFVLLDPQSEKTLIDINGSRLFTPASNTKILTYHASKIILKDFIPALSYIEKGDSLIIRGTGDPLFLGRFDQDSIVYHFLKKSKQSIYFDYSNFKDGRFGPGWAWDDYDTYYQKEITPLPINSNGTIISIDSNQMLTVYPSSHFDRIKIDSTITKLWKRSEGNNDILINPDFFEAGYDYDIPINFGDQTIEKLLSRSIEKPVYPLMGNSFVGGKYKGIYHSHADSLYKAMMIESDNYIAEQLLLCISHHLLGFLDASAAIDSVNRSVFQEIEDPVRWVDGSGLSRYNLVSPHRLAWTLSQIYKDVAWEEIQWTFPSGQVESTLDSIFSKPLGIDYLDEPFIYAKTGTLSNNHNLSGYITTQSGKTYIFSFMNNHYVVPNREIRKAMHEILSMIYFSY